MKKTCSYCKFFLGKFNFVGECHLTEKTTYKHLNSSCEYFKLKEFVQRPPEYKIAGVRA